MKKPAQARGSALAGDRGFLAPWLGAAAALCVPIWPLLTLTVLLWHTCCTYRSQVGACALYQLDAPGAQPAAGAGGR